MTRSLSRITIAEAQRRCRSVGIESTLSPKGRTFKLQRSDLTGVYEIMVRTADSTVSERDFDNALDKATIER